MSTDELLRPVSARSAILSILMSAEQASLTSREICTATTSVGYAEATARVAASRMVTAGDMVRGDGASPSPPAFSNADAESRPRCLRPPAPGPATGRPS